MMGRGKKNQNLKKNLFFEEKELFVFINVETDLRILYIYIYIII